MTEMLRIRVILRSFRSVALHCWFSKDNLTSISLTYINWVKLWEANICSFVLSSLRVFISSFCCFCCFLYKKKKRFSKTFGVYCEHKANHWLCFACAIYLFYFHIGILEKTQSYFCGLHCVKCWFVSMLKVEHQSVVYTVFDAANCIRNK